MGTARQSRVFALLAAYLARSALVHAQSPSEERSREHANVRLEIEHGAGAESCLDAGALSKSVERRLRRRVFDPGKPGELRVRVEWVAEPSWTARVALSDAFGLLGTREISTEARHCSAIDDSLALVVALLVDTPPERPEPDPVETESPAPERVPPAPLTAPTPIQLPASTLGPREPFAFDLRACALGAVALLPGIAPGAEIAFGLRPPRGPWIRVTLDLYGGKEHELGEGSGVRLSVRRAGLELCPVELTPGGLRAEICAALRTGQIVAEGYGFDANRESSKLFHGLALGGRVFAPLGALDALFGLTGEIPFTRDQFTARPDGVNEETYRPRPVALTAQLGIRYQL